MNPALARLYSPCPVSMQNLVLARYSAILDRERYRGEFKEYAALFPRSQWFSRGKLEAYQDETLRALIRRAYDSAPYYRAVFDQRAMTPGRQRSRGDFVKRPLLSKDDIAKIFDDLISNRVVPSGLKHGHMSGTARSPLQVRYDSSVIHATYAVLGRQYRWAKCRLTRDGEHIAVARGNVIVPLDKKEPPFWRYNRFHNQLVLSSFHMSKEHLGDCFEEMRRYGVRVLDGYTSELYLLAKFLCDNGAVFASAPSLPRWKRCAISSAKLSRNASSAECATITRSPSAWRSRRSAKRTRVITWRWSTAFLKSWTSGASRPVSEPRACWLKRRFTIPACR